MYTHLYLSLFVSCGGDYSYPLSLSLSIYRCFPKSLSLSLSIYRCFPKSLSLSLSIYRCFPKSVSLSLSIYRCFPKSLSLSLSLSNLYVPGNLLFRQNRCYREKCFIPRRNHQEPEDRVADHYRQRRFRESK